MTRTTDKQYIEQWEEFAQNVRKSTAVDVTETPAQKKVRIKRLRGDTEAAMKYYFPNFYRCDPAPFHLAASRRIFAHPEWYEVRHWSRELAKSTRSMMEDLLQMLWGLKKFKLLISSSYDAAEKLFMPYMIHLESNLRIINDFGVQEKTGRWIKGDITTRMGFSIVALGARQPPRGMRKEEVRPDIIELDDFDTDEECLNEDIINKKWKWVTEALIPTRSNDTPTLIRWNGNIIAVDCCIVRAQKFADKVDTINLTDLDGISSWPQKNTQAHIDRIFKITPWSAIQKEYFNNPFSEGRAFPSVTFGKVPPLNKFPYLVAYGDPATSNSDNGKGTTGASYKALVLVGLLNNTYYVIKAFVGQMKNAQYVDCFYAMELFVDGKAPLFSYIENNTLQEPFFDQVFKPLFFEKSKQFNRMISIIPDPRKKPDKYTRIEGTLEPINRLGCLIFNKDFENDDNMKLLVDQLKSVSAKSKTMDGPDALEGAVVCTNLRRAYSGGIELFTRPTNTKRY